MQLSKTQMCTNKHTHTHTHTHTIITDMLYMYTHRTVSG